MTSLLLLPVWPFVPLPRDFGDAVEAGFALPLPPGGAREVQFIAPRCAFQRLETPMTRDSVALGSAGDKSLIHAYRAVMSLPLEPVSYLLGESRQRHEPALAARLGIKKLAVMQPRLRIQHQAQNQKDLATASEFVLIDRCHHGLAFWHSALHPSAIGRRLLHMYHHGLTPY
jgi:hypothetical protein